MHDVRALPHTCLCARHVLAVESHCKSMQPSAATCVSKHQETRKERGGGGGGRTGGGGRPAEAGPLQLFLIRIPLVLIHLSICHEQWIISVSSTKPHEEDDTLLSKTQYLTVYLD